MSYRGLTVAGCGFWCQGPVILQTLRFLEGFDLSSYRHNSASYIHLLTEALKFSFSDRHAYYGDPAFVDVPGEELLSEVYAVGRRAQFDPSLAYPGMPPFGSTRIQPKIRHPDAAQVWREPPVDTSYVCVVDRHGNAFSATPSDDALNAPMIPGTGLVPSTRGLQSFTDPDNPSCLGPGKRPRLTPNPLIVTGPVDIVMPMGSPGADVQPQAMLQTILNFCHFSMTPQEAVDAPRFATYSFPSTSDPHDYNPGRLTLEGRIDQGVADDLVRLGHKVTRWPEWDWRAGCVCAVVADLATGVKEGAADQRRPSGVRGR